MTYWKINANPKHNTIIICITLTRKDDNALRKLAARTHKSINTIVQNAIKKYLVKYGKN